ncbi:MAG: tetratricopeptide repeat protein [Magnetovibrio sp.]|nr:tetratricopeptide repeat protein [Magnetovibrio sp.]
MSELILDPSHTLDLTKTKTSQDVIIDGSTKNFTRDVVEASANIPVVVYFGAPESAASETMSNLLAKLVKRAGGLVKMVRLNIHDNQALAQQLQVQSVPTVFAFVDGRAADAFSGSQGEAQLQIFLNKLIGDAKPPIEAAMESAKALLDEGLGVEAEEAFNQVLSQDETLVAALAGVIRAIAVQGEFERAQDILEALDAKTRSALEICQAVSALELAQESTKANPQELVTLKALVQAEPKNLQAQLDLAHIHYAVGETSQAIDLLLNIVAIDRNWNDQAGRKQLVKIFDALGVQHPSTIDARKRLSAVLFS